MLQEYNIWNTAFHKKEGDIQDSNILQEVPFQWDPFSPCIPLAPLQMLGTIPPTPASQASLPSKQTDGNQGVIF